MIYECKKFCVSFQAITRSTEVREIPLFLSPCFQEVDGEREREKREKESSQTAVIRNARA